TASTANTTLLNNIIAGNIPNGVYFDDTSPIVGITYGDFYNSPNFAGSVPAGLGVKNNVNLNGDSCDVFYNIFLDPLFVNIVPVNYHLTANSPCIDAGDPSSPLDPDSTIADIGAFYFHHTLGIGTEEQAEIPDNFFCQPNFPNPFNPTTTFRFGLPTAAYVTFEVFDIAGRRVGKSGSGTTPTTEVIWYPAGIHEISFEAAGLPSGVYIYRLQMDGLSGSGATPTMKVGKMVLLK
ncbi:MAG: T9SS type A sorting domain-containing protein, partial [bacterium]